jgi:hypothetical protein
VLSAHSEERELFLPDAIPSFPEQRTHVATDNSCDSGHRVDGDVLVAGFDQRDILLCQADPLSQLSLRQAGFDSGSSRVLAKNLPQIAVMGGGRPLGENRRRAIRPFPTTQLPFLPFICSPESAYRVCSGRSRALRAYATSPPGAFE